MPFQHLSLLLFRFARQQKEKAKKTGTQASVFLSSFWCLPLEDGLGAAGGLCAPYRNAWQWPGGERKDALALLAA